MLDPVVSMTLSVGFGLMLLLASLHKMGELDRFRHILADYRVVPDRLLPAVAILVPAVEAGLGLAWLFAGAKAGPAVLTAGLLCLYTAVIGINLARGRVHISCGCNFGTSAGGADALSAWLVVRNLVLIAACAGATLPPSARSATAADYLTVGAALAVIVTLFAASNQLIRNAAAIHSWRARVTGND